MTDEVHFQWQNEFLLQTIYPLRETKLRDFLTFYQEIDLWEEYKNKTAQDLEADILAYRKTQLELGQAVFARYDKQKLYFLTADVTAIYQSRYPDPEPDQLQGINFLHRTFARYFPQNRGYRVEGWFVAARITELEANRKTAVHRISENQRFLRNMGAGWIRKEEYERKTKLLLDSGLPMLDEELDQLHDFLSAISNLEKRQARLKSWKDALTRNRAKQTGALATNQAAARPLEDKKRRLVEERDGLQNPPDAATLEAYFQKADVAPDYQSLFPAPEKNVVAVFNQVHQRLNPSLGEGKSNFAKLNGLKIQLNNLESYLKENESKLRQISTVIVPMYAVELGKMKNLVACLENKAKSREELDALLAQKVREIAELDARLATFAVEADRLRSEIAGLDKFLGIPDREQLTRFAEFQPVTREDIVHAHAEKFRASLLDLDHQQLLEAVFARFRAAPERYPLWLQYMVIHFSGMRYKSAHGSWASAKNLLLNLSLKKIGKTNIGVSDDTIEILRQEKLACYEAGAGQPPGPDQPAGPAKPALSQTTDPRWRAKINAALKGLKSDYPYLQRKALQQLAIDERSYEIEQLSDQQALDNLEDMKSELPEWMWKEILQLTALKLEEVDDADWETVTADDVKNRYSLESKTFRQIMDAWKQEFLTGWREEHDKSNQLIVTRAVCNEIAEHIQHLRGHSPAGGLAAKPRWYQRHEKHPTLAANPEPPFFKKAFSAQAFKEGASILWIRFVTGFPDQWRIAAPLELKSGENLLPKHFFSEGDAGWRYHMDPDWKFFRRTGDVIDEKGEKVRTEQYLRWMHEATVVLVTETADGPTVLTFETALPYEDKRQATMGVSKYTLEDLEYRVGGNYFIGSFIGYAPEGDLPIADLKELLDWNKILRRPALNAEETDTFWKRATQTALGHAPCPICQPK